MGGIGEVASEDLSELGGEVWGGGGAYRGQADSGRGDPGFISVNTAPEKRAVFKLEES